MNVHDKGSALSRFLSQADDLLIQLVLGRVQQVCSAVIPGADMFLEKSLLNLMAYRKVSDDVRFRVCCLLTVFLVSAGPDQRPQVCFAFLDD